jgi:hypothetical protein
VQQRFCSAFWGRLAPFRYGRRVGFGRLNLCKTLILAGAHALIPPQQNPI